MAQPVSKADNDRFMREFFEVAGGLLALGLVVWGGLHLDALLRGHRLALSTRDLLRGVWHVPAHARDPRAAFPASARLPAGLWGYVGPALVLVLLVLVVDGRRIVRWRRSRDRDDHRHEVDQVRSEVERLGQASDAEIRAEFGPTPGALRLGTSGRNVVWVPVNMSLAIVMGSQMGKTTAAVGMAIDHNGPLVVTSATKADLFHLTALVREEKTGQPTLLFDPDQLVPDWPHPLRWSPIRGCDNPDVAVERAFALMSGVATGANPADAHFHDEGRRLLKLALHAAAIDARDVTTLARWTRSPVEAKDEVAGILGRSPVAGDWLHEWREIVKLNPRQLDGMATTAGRALLCFGQPRIAAACSPAPEDAFDAEAWIKSGGTIHVLSSGKTASSTAPIAAALVEDIMSAASRIAAPLPRGRLDPPLRLVLDELPNVAPLPNLPLYLATAGGQGVQIVCISQALAQYVPPYGRDAAVAIMTAFGAIAVGGGVKQTAELREFSEYAGQVEVRRTDHSESDQGTSTASHREDRQVFEFPELGHLRRHEVVLLSHLTRPIRVSLQPWWRRADHRAVARLEARSKSGERETQDA